MANTDITQRAQYERSDLLASGEGIRRGSEKGAAIYSVIALIIGIGLSVVALATIESWAQWVVLGVIVAFTTAVMFAIGPNRVAAPSPSAESSGCARARSAASTSCEAATCGEPSRGSALPFCADASSPSLRPGL